MVRDYSVLLNIFIISLFFTTCFSISFGGKTKHVIITNGLPGPEPPLYLHCKSADNDLGMHVLSLYQSYDWSFKMNWIKSTLFSCDFWWLGRHEGFVVYNDDIDKIVGGNQFNYQVRADGFYLLIKGSWQKVKIW